jgi:hypothetical protein
MGRFTLNVLLSFAQFEREITGERIRDKFAASKKKGMWMGGTPPLGYDVEERALVINNIEAERVCHIFQRYLQMGSVSRLQINLRESQVLSKLYVSRKGNVRGGVNFGRGALYVLLQNRLYIGEIEHRGNIYQGMHQGIVPAELWSEVQDLLSRNRQKEKGGKAKTIIPFRHRARRQVRNA